jgi:hypothetical protein
MEPGERKTPRFVRRPAVWPAASAAAEGSREGNGKDKGNSLRSRRHPALCATFSRKREKGFVVRLGAVSKRYFRQWPALLPFTGEGARRADEGASAASQPWL